MSKHEAARRDDQRRASLAASQAEPARSPLLLPDKLLLSHADLHALGITYSRQHLYRLMASGSFPKPVALGSQAGARKAWRGADIAAWIAALT